MTPEQIALVQESAQRLAPQHAALSVAFYTRLFERAPQVRGMFPDDMAAQERKFVDSLDAIVAAIPDFDAFASRTRALGRTHRQHHVASAHYAVAGGVLLEVVAEADDEHWDSALAEAWTTAYDLVAESMMLAARGR